MKLKEIEINNKIVKTLGITQLVTLILLGSVVYKNSNEKDFTLEFRKASLVVNDVEMVLGEDYQAQLDDFVRDLLRYKVKDGVAVRIAKDMGIEVKLTEESRDSIIKNIGGEENLEKYANESLMSIEDFLKEQNVYRVNAELREKLFKEEIISKDEVEGELKTRDNELPQALINVAYVEGEENAKHIYDKLKEGEKLVKFKEEESVDYLIYEITKSDKLWENVKHLKIGDTSELIEIDKNMFAIVELVELIDEEERFKIVESELKMRNVQNKLNELVEEGYKNSDIKVKIYRR